jgi:hypothetical protein
VRKTTGRDAIQMKNVNRVAAFIQPEESVVTMYSLYKAFAPAVDTLVSLEHHAGRNEFARIPLGRSPARGEFFQP